MNKQKKYSILTDWDFLKYAVVLIGLAIVAFLLLVNVAVHFSSPIEEPEPWRDGHWECTQKENSKTRRVLLVKGYYEIDQSDVEEFSSIMVYREDNEGIITDSVCWIYNPGKNSCRVEYIAEIKSGSVGAPQAFVKRIDKKVYSGKSFVWDSEVVNIPINLKDWDVSSERIEIDYDPRCVKSIWVRS